MKVTLGPLSVIFPKCAKPGISYENFKCDARFGIPNKIIICAYAPYSASHTITQILKNRINIITYLLFLIVPSY